MHVDEGLWCMRCEPRSFAAASHRVPLVANAPGVEYQRIFLIDTIRGYTRRGGNETGFAVRVIEAAIFQKASGS
jgi:hypothetical protein